MRAGERPNHPVELLSASIDGEIKPAEEAALEAHLEGCTECRGLLEDFRKLEGTIADEAPPAVPADLRERILAGLASRTVTPSIPFWKQAMPLAAAASLVMAVLLWWGRPDPPPLLQPERSPKAAAEAAPELRQALREQAYEVITPRADRRAVVPPPVVPGPSRVTEERSSRNAATRPVDARRRDEKEEVFFESATPQAPAPPVVAGNDGNASALKPQAPPTAPAPAAPADEKKTAGTEAEGEVMARLRSLGYVGSGTAGASPEGSAAGTDAREQARMSVARRNVAGQPTEPVSAMKAAQAQAPGLFAPPYTVRLVADRRMLVQSGMYTCTAAVDDADGQRIIAALQESERVRPPAQKPAAPEAAAPEAAGALAESAPADPAAVNASIVIPATPEAREVILRLVRERYRRALEARCGPLPN